MKKYLVGCDIGTGGTKAVVMDLHGQVLGHHFVEYCLHTPQPGWAEHDPEVYWQAAAETIRVAIESSGVSPKDIGGVGLSGMSPACILVDENHKPLRPSHIWMDRRAITQSEWIKKEIGEDAIFELSANPVDPYYGITKLMWERDNAPAAYERAYKVLNPKDYPLLKLTGKAVTDYSNAALMGICFDIRRRRWDEDMVKRLGIRYDVLPELYPCDEVVGEVTAEAAQVTGLAEGTPVVAGTVDANAAWLSMGVIDDGENALTMGTAACWGVAHDDEFFAPGLIILPHVVESERKYFTAAAMVAGGALIRWFRDNFGQQERIAGRELGVSAYDIMNLEAAKVAPGCDGLITLPYFMGERTPVWDAEARGILFGLSLSHGRGHIIRSLMEGVGFGVRQNIEIVREHGVKVLPSLGLVEGGAVSALWRQIMADIAQAETVFLVLSMAAAKVPPGSDGLIVLPYFMGERTPIWDPLARGVVFGWSPAHTRSHLIRAMMESVAYGLRHNFELMKGSGIEIKYPLAMGEGGAQSAVWRQIVCDVLNIPGVYMQENKGAPFGNAINAGVGVGLFDSYDVVKQWVSWTDHHEPIAEHTAVYDGLYGVFRKLYPALKGLYQELAEVTGYI